MALASILGPFGVHLLKFTLDTHHGSLMDYLGLLEFPVRFVMPYTSQHTRDVLNLSYEYDYVLLLSCLHVRLRNGLLNMTKYMSSTDIIRNFGRLRAIL